MNNSYKSFLPSLALGLLMLLLTISSAKAVYTEENVLSIIPEGQSNLQELLDLLKSLKPGDKVRLSTYILTDDAIGRTVMHSLAEAGKRGAEVHVIMDPSNFYLPDRYVQFLESSNVQVKEFHPMGGETIFGKARQALSKGVQWMNNRSHDKMLIVERLGNRGIEHVAFMGSSNLVDAHFQLDPTLLFERQPSRLKKAMVVLQVARDRLRRYIGQGGRSQKEMDRIINQAVDAEAGASTSFAQEMKYRLSQARGKYSDLGYQYLDVNYLMKGQAAKDLMEYHDRVWAGEHAFPRKIDPKDYAPDSPIKDRIKQLKDFPIAVESNGKQFQLTYSQELYDKVSAAELDSIVEVDAKKLLVSPKLKKDLERQSLQFKVPEEYKQAVGNREEIIASQEEIRKFLAAPSTEKQLLDGLSITPTDALKEAARTARVNIRLPSGELLDLSLDDLETVQTAKNRTRVRVGAKPLLMDAATKDQILRADPTEVTRRWVERGHDSVVGMGYVEGPESRSQLNRAFHRVGKIDLYLDKMKGNVPQGSEQGPLEAIRRAKAGDTVEVAGEKVLYTVDLFRDLERAGLGDSVEINGKPVVLTEEIMKKFAAATPADELNLLNQYGQLTPEVRDEMLAASRRGVKINFVVNGPKSMWDGTLPVRGYELTFDELVSTGAKVIEYPADNKQIHAKIITVTNPMGQYVPSNLEAQYPANPQNPGVLRALAEQEGRKKMFRDVLKEQLTNSYLDPRHLTGFTITGTSNFDARSMSLKMDPEDVKGMFGRVVAWSRGLRNTEINIGVTSLGFAEEMNQRIQQAGAAGKVVANRGKKARKIVRSCPGYYHFLAPLI